MKISIITATYNSGGTIASTLESVLSQTHNDYELIIIDGASGDNTLEVVEAYRERFGGRMRCVSEPDKGIYDAMNKGIAMATGDVVGILNSDDFYTAPHVLERVNALMSQGDVDAVYGDVHFVHPGNLHKQVRYYSSKPFRRWTMRYGLMPAHPSFYCLREVYGKYGSFDTSYRVASDFENLLRLIYIHRIRTAYIPMDFVTMRTGGSSTSGWKSHKNIMLDHCRALRANGVRSSMLLLSLRYLYKLIELALSKHPFGRDENR